MPLIKAIPHSDRPIVLLPAACPERAKEIAISARVAGFAVSVIRIVGGSTVGAAQEVPEDGVILTDHSLRLIASDSRAVAILKDVSEHNNGADSVPLSVPREISEAFLSRTMEGWSGIQARFFGKRHNYRCTMYQTESQSSVL